MVSKQIEHIATNYLGTIAHEAIASAIKECNCPDPRLTRFPSAQFVFETAFEQLRATSEASECPVADTVTLCALINGPLPEARARLRAALDAGYGTIKIKVGDYDVEDAVALVKEARAISSGACTIRLDANQNWHPYMVLALADAAGNESIEYIEEPTPYWTVKDYRELYEQTGIPCALDETLQELSYYLFYFGDYSVSKLYEPLQRIAETAQFMIWKPSVCMHPRHLGLNTEPPVVLSGAYESGVGTAAIIKYASRMRSGRAVGVDTYSRLAADILKQPLPIDGATADIKAVNASLADLDKSQLESLWQASG
jgi:O-succinylbenzoate synthase